MQQALELIVRYGEVVLFTWVLADQAGVPVPVVPLLLGAGALVGGGRLSLTRVITITTVATLLADLLWYELGRIRGRRTLDALCRITLEPDSCVRRAQDLFVAHRVRFLLGAKFLPGMNPVAAGLAGVVAVHPVRFLLYDTVGALLWAGGWVSIGYLFSDAIEEAALYAARLGGSLIVLLAVVATGYVSVRYARRRRFLRGLRIARITADDLKARLDRGEATLIVDLRTPLDVDAAPYLLPGALRISPAELDRRHGEIPRDVDVILYCT